MWLMVRVVLARPLGPEAGNVMFSDGALSTMSAKIQSLADEAIHFSEVQGALAKLEYRPTRGDENEQKRFIELMARHDSLEHFITRPMLSRGNLLGLSVPSPRTFKREFNSLEERLYEVLAIRYLYPEVRLIHGLSQRLANKLGRDSYILNRSQRLSAQKSCFSQDNYSEKCLYENGLKPVILAAVAAMNEEHDAKISGKAVYEEVLALIEKGGDESVVYKSAFVTDAANDYIEKVRLPETLMTCVNYPRSFFTWQLVSAGRCDVALEEELEQKGIQSEKVRAKIIRNLTNGFSPLQLALVSLSEEVLNRGVFCMSDSCVVRKLRDRLNEWSSSHHFNSRELDELSEVLATWWQE